jgi:hypothetical protein
MAERFVYLAAIGFVLAVVAGFMLVKPFQRQVLLGCLGIWAVWGAWRLVTRVHDWQQPVALYRNSLEATPRSAYLQKNVAAIYAAQGKPQQALGEYTRRFPSLPTIQGRS